MVPMLALCPFIFRLILRTVPMVHVLLVSSQVKEWLSLTENHALTGS